jgi:hypothetical protein
MKKFKLLSLATALTLGLASLNSCTEDKCKDVTCDNGGACVDGTCECADGYEGTTCQTESRDKIIASFTVSETCSISGNANYTVTITKSASDVTKVVVSPFGGYTGATGILTLEGTTLTLSGVNGTTLNFSAFNGTTNASGSTLTINYSVSDGSATETCQGTWTKQ